MGIFTLILNLIIALPKIYALFKEIQDSIKKEQMKKVAREYELAKTKLENAKTKSEVENAADDFLSKS